MRELQLNDIDSVNGGVSAEGVCRAYVTTVGGTIFLAAGVGWTGGLGFVAGAGLYSLGASVGSSAASFICAN